MDMPEHRSFLDSIPGWSGYRDRERRRESDRLIRERLARDYGEIADGLGRLAARLAQDRKLQAIRYVDAPHGRLNHFIDRLRTATYGYAGLFSDRPVDADALDQIAAFDLSLGEGIDDLRAGAEGLSSADPDDPVFRERSEALSERIETLLDRFDRRSEIIDTGEPKPEAEVSALLALGKPRTGSPTAYDLHDGDGITFRNVNYSVIGRITVETSSESWRDFQLKGDDGRSWLRVPASSGDRFWWCRTVEIESTDDDEVSVEGASFRFQTSTDGTAEVIGQAGASGVRDLKVSFYQPTGGNRQLTVYHWRSDELALLGESIDPAELELWSREGGTAV